MFISSTIRVLYHREPEANVTYAKSTYEQVSKNRVKECYTVGTCLPVRGDENIDDDLFLFVIVIVIVFVIVIVAAVDCDDV